MELNGFLIDKYNQYGLEEKKDSICPLCSHTRKKAKDKCASLHWDTGLGICHHCGESFQLHTYKKKETFRQITKTYKKPEWKNHTKINQNVVKWFEQRKISQMTLIQAKITSGLDWMPQCKKETATIRFNYFREGELINIKYRMNPKGFKLESGAELIFYNIDSCKHSDYVIIVEGEIDVLSFIESGIIPVISVPNGSQKKNPNFEYIDNCIDYFDNKKKIYLALDNDEAGNVTKTEMIRRFGAERCYLVNFEDCKDANEYLDKYGKEKLQFVIHNAELVPLEGVSSVLDWDKQFDDYLLNGFKSGFKFGIKSFDKVFSTYTGQYIVVTGPPSAGKSDFVDAMCIGYNMNYGWKIAYASPENKPNHIHAGKLIAKITGKWINKKEYVYSDWCTQAKHFIHDNFKFIDLDKYDLDTTLNKAKELIYRFGIKCLVIDPFNKVRLSESLNKGINEYTNDYLIKIDDFARKHDILIILVAHPVKPGKDEKKNYEPSFYDIKGGGEFYDMSPHGISLRRDYESGLVKAIVMKVKFSHLGQNNKFVWLKWNEANGRYTDFESQDENPELCQTILTDNSNWLIKDSPQINMDLRIEPMQKKESVEIESNNDFYDQISETPF
jgi:twinkle protein